MTVVGSITGTRKTLVATSAPGGATVRQVNAVVTLSLAMPLPLIPTTIMVTPSPLVILAGGTQQEQATIFDQRGSPIAGLVPNWVSGNPGVATVNATGLVTAVGPGITTITASFGSATPAVVSMSVLTDVTELAAMLGSARVLSIHDVRYGGFAVAGAITSWPDARGQGLALAGTAALVGADKTVWYVQTTPASSQALATHLDPRYDLSVPQGRTIIYIGYRDEGLAGGKTPVSIAGPGHAPALDLLSFDAAPNGVMTDALAGGLVNALASDRATEILPGGNAAPRLMTDGSLTMAIITRAPTTAGLWVPPVPLTTIGGFPNAPQHYNALMLGGDAALGTYTPSRTRAVIVLDGAPTASDIAVITQWAYKFHSLPLAAFVFMNGDSRTVFPNDSTITGLARTDSRLATAYGIFNYALGGKTMATIVSQYAALEHPAVVAAAQMYGRRIGIVWAGVNDQPLGQTPAQVWANYQAWCAAVRADGGLAIVCTEISSNRTNWDGAGNWKQTFNALVRAGGASYDGLADLGATAMGADNAFSNGALFVDGVHETASACATYLAPTIAGAVAALITAPGAVASAVVSPTALLLNTPVTVSSATLAPASLTLTFP